jgi:G3E family GTPase
LLLLLLPLPLLLHLQSREQLVELQNGCVCCSLRLDLVQAIARLAAAGCFDLLLLESTGVSEPLQVAEIFSADVPVDMNINSSSGDDGSAGDSAAAAAAGAVAAAGSDSAAAAAVLLRDVAYLDTAVTVVDAHQLMHNLHSIYTFRVRRLVGFSWVTVGFSGWRGEWGLAGLANQPAELALLASLFVCWCARWLLQHGSGGWMLIPAAWWCV